MIVFYVFGSMFNVIVVVIVVLDDVVTTIWASAIAKIVEQKSYVYFQMLQFNHPQSFGEHEEKMHLWFDTQRRRLLQKLPPCDLLTLQVSAFLAGTAVCWSPPSCGRIVYVLTTAQ